MDFVSFEIAKKLKEKGYGESWDYVYNDDGVICIPCYNLTEEDTIPMCPAPQIHEVLKWLREEKNLFIDISLCAKGYYGMVYSTIFPKDKDFSDGWLIDGKYPTYEKASLAGIEYVLNNLI